MCVLKFKLVFFNHLKMKKVSMFQHKHTYVACFIMCSLQRLCFCQDLCLSNIELQRFEFFSPSHLCCEHFVSSSLCFSIFVSVAQSFPPVLALVKSSTTFPFQKGKCGHYFTVDGKITLLQLLLVMLISPEQQQSMGRTKQFVWTAVNLFPPFF